MERGPGENNFTVKLDCYNDDENEGIPLAVCGSVRLLLRESE